MSGVRRTEDLNSLKTRALIIQGFDGTFAPTGAVVAAYDGNGHYAPTVDLSVNTVDVSSGSFNQVVLVGSPPGTPNGVLTYTADGLVVNGAPIIISPFYTLPFQPLDPNTTSLPTLIASYNQLLNVMALQQAFVSLPPSISIVFQTRGSIGFVTFPNALPSTRTSTSVFIEAGTVSAIQVVTDINAACLEANMPLNFYVSPAGVVSVLVSTGYSFSVVDASGAGYGTSALFLNHLGLGSVLSVSYPSATAYVYSGNTVGTMLFTNVGSLPTVRGKPSSPPTVTGVTGTTITITIQTPSVIPPVTTVNIYVYTPATGYVSKGVVPWTQTSYTVTGLTPLTTYSIAVAFQTDYDEGPRSDVVTATTTA